MLMAKWAGGEERGVHLLQLLCLVIHQQSGVEDWGGRRDRSALRAGGELMLG
jgi:hypothetical protein